MNLVRRPFHPDSIRTVLLELDGVVIDSEPIDERSPMVASERLGHKLAHMECKVHKTCGWI